MTADRWQQIKTLFYAASERCGSERAAFLEAACLDDEVLRCEVESLLATDAQAGSFLKHPVLAADTPATEVAAEQANWKPGRWSVITESSGVWARAAWAWSISHATRN
jgi:hypothetical protein